MREAAVGSAVGSVDATVAHNAWLLPLTSGGGGVAARLTGVWAASEACRCCRQHTVATARPSNGPSARERTPILIDGGQDVASPQPAIRTPRRAAAGHDRGDRKAGGLRFHFGSQADWCGTGMSWALDRLEGGASTPLLSRVYSCFQWSGGIPRQRQAIGGRKINLVMVQEIAQCRGDPARVTAM